MTHRVTNRQTPELVRCLALAVCVLLMAPPLVANDWPEWRGAGRDGVWTDTGIVQELPVELAVKWRVPVNAGGCSTSLLPTSPLAVDCVTLDRWQ